jgi:hypothetical protein
MVRSGLSIYKSSRPVTPSHMLIPEATEALNPNDLKTFPCGRLSFAECLEFQAHST